MSLDPDPIYAEIQDSSKPAPASRDPDLSDCAPPKDGYADKNTQTDAVVVYSELQSRDKDSDNHIVAPSGDEYAVPRKLLSWVCYKIRSASCLESLPIILIINRTGWPSGADP